MKLRRWVIAAFLALSVSDGYAAETANFEASTTRDLVELCSAVEGDELFAAAMGYCLGFIDAAHDYHQSVTSGDLLKPISCPDHQVTRQEVRDVFLDWARSNEALLDSESPIHGLMRAASARWPCP